VRRVVAARAVALRPQPLDEDVRPEPLEGARAVLDAAYRVRAWRARFVREAHSRVERGLVVVEGGGGLEEGCAGDAGKKRCDVSFFFWGLLCGKWYGRNGLWVFIHVTWSDLLLHLGEKERLSELT
jgi:hypothetical protein